MLATIAILAFPEFHIFEKPKKLVMRQQLFSKK